jgi:hypothetical protein
VATSDQHELEADGHDKPELDGGKAAHMPNENSTKLNGNSSARPVA